jgi:hypothetical protein
LSHGLQCQVPNFLKAIVTGSLAIVPVNVSVSPDET